MQIDIRFGNLIKEVTPSLYSLDIIVQQVNAMGVMGSGFAKELRDTYPEVFDTYQKHIKFDQFKRGINEHKMGDLIIHNVHNADGSSLTIANIVGQLDYGRDGNKYTSYDALDKGFSSLVDFCIIRLSNLPAGCKFNIHFPTLGCGLGGGKWSVVEAIINSHLTTEYFNSTLWVPVS